jgi:hypothetical protein
MTKKGMVKGRKPKRFDVILAMLFDIQPTEPPAVFPAPRRRRRRR